jgi:phosphoribosylaminoimidazole-succinocarboxamide synthase
MSNNIIIGDDFEYLPLVKEGESKIIRYLGQGKVAIRLKPTIYSYTQNRYGTIPKSEKIRVQASEILVKQLTKYQLQHAFHYYDERMEAIVADLIIEATPNGLYFTPQDINVSNLPVFSPIEVIVKKSHVGTPKYRYRDIDKYPTRNCQIIKEAGDYPNIIVRFDWRNPLHDENNKRLADEVMPEEMADWWIDTKQAKNTAKKAFVLLEKYLLARGIKLLDICFFIDASGKIIYSEISPDCMRVRANDESLDKDIWRAGGSSEEILRKWSHFLELIS